MSWSLEKEYKESLLLVKDIIYGLPTENGATNVGLIAFSTETLIQIFLSESRNKHQMIERVDFYRIVGRTNTPSAFDAFLTNQLGRNGDRPNAPNYLIVITDGFSNINPEQTIPKANQIKNQNNTIIVVAMSQEANFDEIRGIASSEEHVFRYSSPSPQITVNQVLEKIN